MGEYFRATLKKKDDDKCVVLSSWAYDNGSKIMEHSYIGNHYVMAIDSLLFNNPQHLAWVGDYTDSDDLQNYSDDQKAVLTTMWRQAWPENDPDDFGQNGPEIEDDEDSPFSLTDMYLYIINHSKKELIILSRYYKNMCQKHNNVSYFMPIHPLPLLTALGHGKGGGCYYGINEDKIGMWAGDIIEIVNWKDYNDFYKNDYNDITDTLDFVES